ncbi:hypothetical protein [Herpetosiphon geysericola]|uniref:Uncharacterized protein n=1 Tax=Herpetosiphon geysericola TaxID=70996 RepID=A0A0P6XPT2_9CHLR|nr:hypothetical protein [Herpetosiphon geysericola]KPL85878.1 hypothetical protein SE18_13210 [Herpetosiphon geysericola]
MQKSEIRSQKPKTEQSIWGLGVGGWGSGYGLWDDNQKNLCQSVVKKQSFGQFGQFVAQMIFAIFVRFAVSFFNAAAQRNYGSWLRVMVYGNN